MQYLDLSENAQTWQELELKRLIVENGADKFKSLDLFGVV
jgi:hypothetical protein